MTRDDAIFINRLREYIGLAPLTLMDGKLGDGAPLDWLPQFAERGLAGSGKSAPGNRNAGGGGFTRPDNGPAIKRFAWKWERAEAP